jgi:WD40 repeat protein
MRPLLVTLVALLALPVRAADPQVSFLRDVAPVLQESCFACHDARKRSGKYDMTTFEKLMAGGANGEAVVPGKVAESDFHALIVTTDDRRMPPRDKGAAVPPERAKLVAAWIAQGAKPDAGLDPKADLVAELRRRWVPPVPPEHYRFPAVVNALAFTPDGTRLVVSGHHELTVWAVPAGKLVERVRTRAERAYAMTFLPGGLLAVAGGRPGVEGDVRLYDIAAAGPTVDGVKRLDGVSDARVLVAKLLEADDSVLCLAATPDGKLLAAGGCDRAARVWDLSAGPAKAKLTQTVENHADWVLGVALSADGKFLATASRDKTAKTWDLAAKESAVTFPDHAQPVNAVAFGPGGATVFSAGGDAKLRAWKPAGDAKGGKPGASLGGHGGEIFRIAADPVKPLLATASADKSVRLWDAAKPSAVATLTGLDDYVYAVAFSPDGKWVAAGGYGGTVAVWPVAGGKPTVTFNASPGHKP